MSLEKGLLNAELQVDLPTKPNRAVSNDFKSKVKTIFHYWCTCGKSSKQPFCDGSHNKYQYVFF